MGGWSKPAVAGLIALAVVACGSTVPSPASAPSRATATAPTRVPPQPTSTATPAGLAPKGPYVVLAGQNIGVWIANPDGSYPTKLTDQWLFGFDLHHALSPRGDRLATVARNEEGYDLIEIRLPDGQTQRLAHLMSITREEEAVLTSEKAAAAMMISGYDNVAWQPPDGRLMAVSAATGGPTSDVYVVDATTGEIRQLTDGPSQAIFPSWSPNGEFIYHVGVSLVPPFGGAVTGFNRVDGSWAVSVSDAEVVAQPPIMHPADFGGWFDERHYLMTDRNGEIAMVDVATGEATAILPDFCPVDDAAQSGVGGALLLSVLPEAGCSSGAGVYLWNPAGGNEPVLLHSERAWELQWLEESGVFDVYPIALFSADGSRRSEPPVPDGSFHPAVSRGGTEAWYVIENTQGRVVVRAAQDDWREILQVRVAQLLWDPTTGETLLIAAQDGTLYAASAPDFEPRVMGHLGGSVEQGIWVP
jgi:hypothetical protein